MLRQSLALFAATILPAAILGCEHHHEEPAATVAYEPVPEGYTYYSDPYYHQGRYNNDYWEWRDRDGRYYRETREEHERHVREHPEYDHEHH